LIQFRFGVLEILKHLAPGVVIDLAGPLMRRLPQRAVVYCILGLVAAVARTMTEFIVVLLLQHVPAKWIPVRR
jgi:hypothetical protein